MSMSLSKVTQGTFALVLAALFLGHYPGFAQGAFNMGGLTATLSTDHVRQKEAARAVNRQIFRDIGSSSRTARNVDLTYRYSRERTQQNLQRFIERTPVESGRADLQRILNSQPGLIENIRSNMKSYGFDPNDTGDAYAMWWMNAWLVANKRDEVPDRGTIAMVRQQVRNAFAASPDFVGTSSAERQEYAEALMLQATMLGSMFEQWKDDPNMLDQLANAAREGAKASDLNLSLMTLTPNGFVPREGVDASGAIGKSDNERVRTASSEDEDKGSMGLALAAGAGLGAVLLGGAVWLRRS